MLLEGPMSSEFMCVLCQKSVPLENIKTDENGKPVHEDCYMQSLGSSFQKHKQERIAS